MLYPAQLAPSPKGIPKGVLIPPLHRHGPEKGWGGMEAQQAQEQEQYPGLLWANEIDTAQPL